MTPLVYCDNNFVIASHDAPEQYKSHLRSLSSIGKIKFVLSPWHWREMAQDKDLARGSPSRISGTHSILPGYTTDGLFRSGRSRLRFIDSQKSKSMVRP